MNWDNQAETRKEKKRWGIWRLLLGLFTLKFLLLMIASISFIVIIINFISVLPGTFLPKSTSSTIAFYRADSFYWLPINFNKDSKTIPELALPISYEQLNKMEEEMSAIMQKRLDEKFWPNVYVVKVFHTEKYTHSNGKTYQNINNISTLSENIVTFGIEITTVSRNLQERIYFYAVEPDFSFADIQLSSFYDAGKDDDNILFVGNINWVGTYSKNFNEFVKLIQNGRWSDGRGLLAKEAFQHLLGKEWEEWNEYVRTDIKFRPYFSETFQSGKKWVLEKFWRNCYGTYTLLDEDQLDCSKWMVKIRIWDAAGVEYPKETFRHAEYTIKNVTTTWPEMTRNALKEYANIITKYNQLKFHDSYFVDMLNFVGTEHGNSNQKVLSKERISLQYFQNKNVGKTNRELVLNSWDIVKFNPQDAKSILDMPGDNDVQDSVFSVKSNKKNTKHDIYKKWDGFVSDKIVSKCTGLPVIYKDIDALINGFDFYEQFGSGANACNWSFKAPPLLEESEMKYYKQFNFIDNVKENAEKTKWKGFLDNLFGNKDKKKEWDIVVTRKKEDYKLNYFYHYTEPKNISLSSTHNSLFEWNYISDVGLDNTTVLWNGIYLKVKSYGIIANEEDGTLDIKRDARDGTPLFSDLPVKFEIGLLTKLDDKIVETTRGKNGELKTSFKDNEVVVNFDKANKVFAKHEELTTGWSIWASLTSIFNSPFGRYLANNYEEVHGVPYNTFLSRYQMISAIDKPKFSEWRDNNTLNIWGTPFLIKKWNENYLNSYFNDHIVQRRFMGLLNDVYHWPKVDGKYSFDVAKILSKYAVLFASIDWEIAAPMPWSKNKVDSISNYKCREYAKSSRAAKKVAAAMLANSDLPYEWIQAKVLLEQSRVYFDCFKGYFEEMLIDWWDIPTDWFALLETKRTDGLSAEEKKDFEEKSKILKFLDDDNSRNKIINALYNIDKNTNDLYFLYRTIKDNDVDIKYEDGNGNLATHDFLSYIDLIEYIVGTDGNPDDNSFFIERLNNIIEALRGEWLLDSEFDIEKEQKEFLKKLDEQQKSFYLYEYRGFKPVMENYKNEETFIKNLELNRNNSFFFDIEWAFSYESERFDKESNLHELYINPNIYLYSYFRGIKVDNKTQAINVRNEDNLWAHKPSGFDKLAHDSSLLFNYADNINNYVLFLPQLQAYANISKDYHHNFIVRSGLINVRYRDADNLTWFNKSILNGMVKYGLVHNYYQNLPLYSQLSTIAKSPVTDGNTLNLHIPSLIKKRAALEALSSDELDKSVSMTQHILFLIPELDMLLRENSEKASRDRIKSRAFNNWAEMERIDATERFALALWSFLSGYDPENSGLHNKRQSLKNAIKFVIKDRLVANIDDNTKKNFLIIAAQEVSKNAFGFYWESTNHDWLDFSSYWAEVNGLWAFLPSKNESQMKWLYEDEERMTILESEIGTNGRINEFVQNNFGTPYNNNRSYSTVIFEEKYIDSDKLREVFEPIINYDPTNDPYKDVVDWPLNEEENGVAREVNELSRQNQSGSTIDNERTWDTPPSEQTDTGTWATTWSGETSGDTEETPSYSSVNTTGLSAGSWATTWFKKDTAWMSLRDYGYYIKGWVDVLKTTGRYLSDFNITVNAIARLDYFSGDSEVEITENTVWPTGRPDEDVPFLGSGSTFNSGSVLDSGTLGADVSNSTDIRTYKNVGRQVHALEKNKQCLLYLEEVDKNLYAALYTFELQHPSSDTFYNLMIYQKPKGLELYGLSYEERMKIFTFLTENKRFLNCNGLSQTEYKIYLDYVRAKIKLELDGYIKNDENIIKSYKVYNNVSRLEMPNIFTIHDNDGLDKANKESIRLTPSYRIQEAMFLNKGNFEWSPKANYKFISTTRWAGNNLLLSDKARKWDVRIFNLRSNILLNTIIANQATLYEWLQELSRELYNYSEVNDVKKIQTFTSIANMGPFYYVYTNNGYIKPESGINFKLVDISSLNSGVFGWLGDPSLMLMDPSLFLAYWEKMGVNAYLDKISNGYCEQKTGNVRIKCKNYMEFLKGMNMPTYLQEMEYLVVLKWAEKFLWEYPIPWGYTAPDNSNRAWYLSHKKLLGQDTFSKNMKAKFNGYYDKYLSTIYENEKERRNGSYVGQCTWFAQLYKNYGTRWHGGEVARLMRGTPWVTVESFSPKNPEHALKVIQPWDIISFHGFNLASGCNYTAASWHIWMVIKTDPVKQTITVAEWNVKHWFKTSIWTYPIKKVCPWEVAHGVKARYSTSEVIFGKWEDAVRDLVWGNVVWPSTWSGASTGTWTSVGTGSTWTWGWN